MKRLIFFILFFSFFFGEALESKGVNSFIKTIKRIKINSLRQKILNEKNIIFEGEVEVLIDNKIHMMAGRVCVDKDKMTLQAQSCDDIPVVIENNDFLILTDDFFLDIEKQTGRAKNISLNVDEGYLLAGCAEKLDETKWIMRDIVYTPCDASQPHWHISANKATVKGRYFIKASNLLFKIGKLPVCYLPSMVFPIQGHSGSGFLMPKFFYDYDSGFGIKQEYYWHINKHCDMTPGIDWRDRKGIALTDEFRWARSPDSFTVLNGQYALVRNMFVRKRDKIVRTKVHHYWISGKEISDICSFKGWDISHLARVDYGTDKRIGYQFFNSIEDVDDTFNNSYLLRAWRPNYFCEGKLEGIRTGRKVFLNLSQSEKELFAPLVQQYGGPSKYFLKKEQEDRVIIGYLPRVSLSSGYFNLLNFLNYRYDLFFDQIIYRQSNVERFYGNYILLTDEHVIPYSCAQIFRAGYKGDFYSGIKIKDSILNIFFSPQYQFRSHVKDSKNFFNLYGCESPVCAYGAHKIFYTCGAKLSLPECGIITDDNLYSYYVQPVISWDFAPKLYQKHWYYMDQWDRLYSQNEISCGVRNNISLKDLEINLDVSQGVDLYSQRDIFPLRRGVSNSHLLPFKYNLEVTAGIFSGYFSQECDMSASTFIHSNVGLGVMRERFGVQFGYIFQDARAQVQKELFSRVPHFLYCSLSIPITKCATLFYDGQFYAEKDRHFGIFDGIKPLIHKVRLEYDGHCWGFYIGLEEKKYRECGQEKNEHAIVFALRFDSLGSFAKKFRRPSLRKEPDVRS